MNVTEGSRRAESELIAAAKWYMGGGCTSISGDEKQGIGDVCVKKSGQIQTHSRQLRFRLGYVRSD